MPDTWKEWQYWDADLEQKQQIVIELQRIATALEDGLGFGNGSDGLADILLSLINAINLNTIA